MTYLLQGFGVFLGVLAGTAVTLLTGWLLQKKNQAQQARNLRFELQLNLGKIDHWLEELGTYRNAVNGDTLNTYFGYVDLGKMVYVTANSMFQSGLLYKYLDDEMIGQLQVILSELSLVGERQLNDLIWRHKQVFQYSRDPQKEHLWSGGGKADAVRHADFWEPKLKGHRKTLEKLIAALG